MRKVAAQPSWNAAVTRRDTARCSSLHRREPLHTGCERENEEGADAAVYRSTGDEVARIAAEIERDSGRAARGSSWLLLDPIEAWRGLPSSESAQPHRAEQRAKREEALVQPFAVRRRPGISAEACGNRRRPREPPRGASPRRSPFIVAYAGDDAASRNLYVLGYEVPWLNGPVFNTRIETALRSEGSMCKAESFARRRCLVPARGFYESHATETVPSERTGRL